MAQSAPGEKQGDAAYLVRLDTGSADWRSIDMCRYVDAVGLEAVVAGVRAGSVEAGVISRREEAARLRHADNPTLLHLRELEKVATAGKLSVVLGEKGLADRIVNVS